MTTHWPPGHEWAGSWKAGSKTFEVAFISGYPISILVGVLVAFLTTAYFWRRQKFSWESLQIIMIVVIPSAIFGSKFYTMLVEGDWSHPFEFSGLSIYGGLIFAIISGLIVLHFLRYSIDRRTAISIILPTILIGQAIGRWGNFANHEVYGGVVTGESLNWLGALKSHMFINGQYRAPLFLYESLISTVGYLLLVWLLNDRGWLKPGATAGLYIIWYSVERLVLQVFRDSDPMNTSYFPGTGVPGISVNLVFSIIFIIVGIALFIWTQGLTRPFDKWAKVIFPKKLLDKFKKEYKLIKPSKEVKFFWVGKKYLREFRIWVPVNLEAKWSKREINRNERNKKPTVKFSTKIFDRFKQNKKK